MLLTDVENEYKKNKWFRLTAIGSMMYILAIIIFIVVFAHVFKSWISPMFLFTSIVVLSLVVGYACLIMYADYCVVHGKCMVFAEVIGILTVVFGSLAVIATIIQAWNMETALKGKDAIIQAWNMETTSKGKDAITMMSKRKS